MWLPRETRATLRDAAAKSSSGIFAAFPAAPFFTRTLQQQAVMKLALLVSPSYAVDLDPRTKCVLEKAGVLPRDLGHYSTSGFDRDASSFKAMLGPDFSYSTLSGGDVLVSDMRAAIRGLLAADTEVAVLLFCGHGVWNGSAQHGALVCSYGQQLPAEEIESIAAQQRFKGTFVRVLNMCEAEGYMGSADSTLAYHASRAETRGAWAHASQPQQDSVADMLPSRADYKGISILATGTFDKTSGNSKGSRFISAWTEAHAAHGQPFTYQELAKVLPECHPGACVNTYGMSGYAGVFGGPAAQVCTDDEPYICFGCGRPVHACKCW